jgi:hypothetical protein
LSIWETVKDTGESLKDAAGALNAWGAAWDMATTPFEDDASFGTALNKIAKRAHDAFDPIINTDTLTGSAFSGVMNFLEEVYDHEMMPIRTNLTLAGHFLYDPVENWGDLFSGEAWGEAFETSRERSFGQTLHTLGTSLGRGLSAADSFGGFSGITEAVEGEDHPELLDPLDRRAYDQIVEQGPLSASLTTGAADFAARWYLDPGVLAGKGIGKYVASKKHRKIVEDDFDALTGALVEKWDKPGVLHKVKDWGNPFHRDGIGGRLDDYIPFTDDLNAAQIHIGTPELRTTNAGKLVAGLLGDANKIEDKAVRHDVKRQILKVALGDRTEVFAARDELRRLQSPEIADALENIAKGSVIDLKTHAAGEQIMGNPVLIAQLQGQLDNQKVVKSAIEQHVRRLDTLVNKGDDVADATPVGVQSALKQVPAPHLAGKRALRREAEQTLPRRLDAKITEVEDKLASVVGARLHKAPAISAVVQNGLVHAPIKLITFPYLHGPLKGFDALRTPHLQGMVNPHDWDGATSQLDSMMKTYGVEPGQRMDLLSKAYMARNETEKMHMVAQVQSETMKAVAARYSKKTGKDIDSAYIEAVMKQVHGKVATHIATANGRMYAATTYGRSADNIEYTMGKARQQGDDTSSLRVDELMMKDGQIVGIDEVDAVPMAFPVLETQGRNMFPLMDFALIKKTMDRDSGFFHRHSQAWAELRREEDALKRMHGVSADWIDRRIQNIHTAQDALVHAGTKFNRGWKMSVLLRLGYPIRVVADDHMRIWAQIGAYAMYASTFGEYRRNLAYNQGTRRKIVAERRSQLRTRKHQIEDLLSNEDALRAYDERVAQVAALDRKIVKAQTAGNQQRVDTLTIQREVIADQAGESPRLLGAMLEDINAELSRTSRSLRKSMPKKRVGEEDVLLPGGYRADGAFRGPFGDSSRASASGGASWRNERWGYEAEEDLYRGMTSEGSYRLYTPMGQEAGDEARHLVAWADAVNNQLGQSRVARFFIDDPDATPEDFVRWLARPEQKQLRERVPHFAHDPEDWGGRVYQLVHDYIPSDDMLTLIRDGKRVQAAQLEKMFADPRTRPNVHGATVMHNLGDSRFHGVVGRSINRVYKVLGEMPTDTLSRSPYFKAIYDSEVKALHARNLAARKYRDEEHLAEADIAELQAAARRNALGQLKRTLFDISAHSNAAHFMRFISPFFAAHQEAMTRWWGILKENPAVLRRIQQTFDMPGKLGLVYDSETGEPVPAGSMVNPNHVLLVQLPEAWGGHNSTDPTHPNFKRGDWKISLNSFNIILQNGSPTNPGGGPISQVPVEWMVDQVVGETPETGQTEMEKLARMFNPYAPNSTLDMLLPSTVKRAVALMRGEKSHETALMLSTNYRDLLVKFREDNGFREPTATEEAAMWERARRETQMEQYLRLMQNALLPYAGGPTSEYEAFRQGWKRINEMGDLQGKDFDWRVERFKELYGEAALPMIYSDFRNPGRLDPSNSAAYELKRHRGLIATVDSRFAGAIVGRRGELGPGAEPSRAAVKFLRNTPVKPGSNETFWSNADPRLAMRDAAIRRGWDDYSRSIDQLQVIAQEAGAQSYRDIPALMGAKKQVIEVLAENNEAWWEDYETGSFGGFESGTLRDLKIIAADKKLNADETRMDIKYLQVYLNTREKFAALLQYRAANGGASTMQAQSNADLQSAFIKILGILEEQSPDLQNYWMPIIDQDPFLRDDDPEEGEGE